MRRRAVQDCGTGRSRRRSGGRKGGRWEGEAEWEGRGSVVSAKARCRQQTSDSTPGSTSVAARTVHLRTRSQRTRRAMYEDTDMPAVGCTATSPKTRPWFLYSRCVSGRRERQIRSPIRWSSQMYDEKKSRPRPRAPEEAERRGLWAGEVNRSRWDLRNMLLLPTMHGARLTVLMAL
ncbi:hypothetical protein VTK26DRAFT_9427 [Humicola hyalothermophila]